VLDFLRSTKERAHRVAAAIIEVDNVIETRRLAVMEVRSGLGYLTKALNTPEAWRNGLAAEVTIALGIRVIAKMPIHAKVAIRNRGLTDEGLVGRTPAFERIGMRREIRVDVQADDVEIVVGKKRRVMAMDASCLANKDFQTLLRSRADCILIAGNEAVERSTTAHELSEIRLNGLAIVDQDAVDNLFITGA